MTASRDLSVEDVAPERWPSLVAAYRDHNYENCLSYARAMAAKSRSAVRFLRLLQDGRQIGLASVRIKKVPGLSRGVAYVSGAPLALAGPSGTSAPDAYLACADALRLRLSQHEGHILLLRPPLMPEASEAPLDQGLRAQGFQKTGDVRSYRTVVVPLSADEAALRKSLHQKWRNCLNQSERAGLTIEAGTGADFAERFLAIYRAMRDVKDFDSTIDPAFFLGLDPGDTGTVILIARSQGRDVGGHVLSLLGTTAVYLFGATNEDGRETRAGYTLQWEAMRLSKARGCQWYDLGGIDETENPGGYQFKTRMGGHIASAAGPYKHVPTGLVGSLLDRALGVYLARQRRKPAASTSVG